LVQVFTNLFGNSLDALKRKQFGPGEQPTITITGRMEGDRSMVILRDNGTGIASHNLGKIFDPFFTTKDVGEGMGLGLSICYQIIQSNGGKIAVTSVPGEFAEFCLEFPAKPESNALLPQELFDAKA
ncbi:MAG: ATP-binding protein, partial [Verrucomicrobiota bacterium]